MSILLKTNIDGETTERYQIFTWYGSSTAVPGVTNPNVVIHQTNVADCVTPKACDTELGLTPRMGPTPVEFWPGETRTSTAEKSDPVVYPPDNAAGTFIWSDTSRFQDVDFSDIVDARDHSVWLNRLVQCFDAHELRDFREGNPVPGAPPAGNAPVNLIRGEGSWAGRTKLFFTESTPYPFSSTIWNGWTDFEWPLRHPVFLLCVYGGGGLRSTVPPRCRRDLFRANTTLLPDDWEDVLTLRDITQRVRLRSPYTVVKPSETTDSDIEYRLDNPEDDSLAQKLYPPRNEADMGIRNMRMADMLTYCLKTSCSSTGVMQRV
ncbi:hypothetical protein MTO96_036441 [Rhipicephalus appendiculatus]